ncbi:hypothetical protein [Blastococcus brunescens]|uniref:Uncharacterized protein n=1 Tax=Blastococcus brunescens TaxID=1564165 RepID=A0ABZ1B8Z7_9ACTN|nr:hypothetical protein [Blastococcus sp. BMG 8361]WRL67297.1 hypothetical protein U6N30_22035 [Blastococcus sp. BMG 8361]
MHLGGVLAHLDDADAVGDEGTGLERVLPEHRRPDDEHDVVPSRAPRSRLRAAGSSPW